MEHIKIEQDRNSEDQGEKRIKHCGEQVGLQRIQTAEGRCDHTGRLSHLYLSMYLCMYVYIYLSIYCVKAVEEKALKQ